MRSLERVAADIAAVIAEHRDRHGEYPTLTSDLRLVERIRLRREHLRTLQTARRFQLDEPDESGDAR